VVLVDYGLSATFNPGNPPFVAGLDSMTPLAEDMIALYDGVTLQSGYLGNPGDVNTIAVGGTIPFIAYGVYSDGSTRAVSPRIYYGGVPQFASSNTQVMRIDQTTGLATAYAPGQTYISVQVGSVTFSPWIVTVH
jgi:hypothetical protein